MEREFQVHRTDSDYALAELWKWVIACLIGLSMGCIGFAVDWGINLLNDAKYQTTASVLRSTGVPLACLTCTNCFCLLLWHASVSVLVNASLGYNGVQHTLSQLQVQTVKWPMHALLEQLFSGPCSTCECVSCNSVRSRLPT